MSLYSLALFVHIIGAIVVVGSSLSAPLLAATLRRSATVEGVREWAGLVLKVGRLVGPFAGLVLLSGLYLGFAGDWWGSGWIEVSLGLFVLAGVGAMGVLDPAAERLVAQAEAAPEGPVPAEVDRARRAPVPTTVESLLLTTDVAIVFLMVTKPGFVGALTVAATAWALGGLLAAYERRHTHVPASAPA